MAKGLRIICVVAIIFIGLTASTQQPALENEEALRERLKQLDQEYRRLNQTPPRPANDACVRAASSVEFNELYRSLLQLKRNLLDLSNGLRKFEDRLSAVELYDVAENLSDYTAWLRDL